MIKMAVFTAALAFSVAAQAARGRHIASVGESAKDCSVSVNFKGPAAGVGGLLKKKGYTGEFKNVELDTAKTAFRMTIDQPASEAIETKHALHELVIFDASGAEIWHSAIKSCAETTACLDSVVKQAPHCKHGKLILK